jgi:hypothetical protein
MVGRRTIYAVLLKVISLRGDLAKPDRKLATVSLSATVHFAAQSIKVVKISMLEVPGVGPIMAKLQGTS